jgi:ABC-type multidrug transport system ATPase subunit
MSGASGAPGATLEVRDLAHRYGPRPVLEGLSFSLSSPGVVAVRGATGAGKSTLLRILAGLLRPTAGRTSLRLGGREIEPGVRPRCVGYAGPELAFYPELTARENLGLAVEARGGRDSRSAASAALARVGLGERADDRVGALSSGMLQRLRLAFALLHAPAVLLLDEPGSHLDAEGRAMLADLVADERGRRLVVIATHDDREGSLADRRIELQGRGLGHPA